MASSTDYNIIIANKKYKKSKRPLQIKIVKYSTYTTHLRGIRMYLCPIVLYSALFFNNWYQVS